MNSGRQLGTMRTRIAIAALAASTAVAFLAFPRMAHAAPTVNVNFSAPNNNVSQSEGLTGTQSVNVTFTLSENNANAVAVTYETQDGNVNDANAPKAIAGKDYAAQTNTIEFPPNTTSKTVVFTVFGDNIDEDNETFSVLLKSVSAGWSKGTNGTVTIIDDDAAPSATIDDRTFDEGNAGTKVVNFPLRLSAKSGRPTKVHVKSQRVRDDGDPVNPTRPPEASTTGNANHGNPDYVAVDTDITIPADTLVVDVPVTINGDIVNESDEYFELQLSEPTEGPSNLQPLSDYATGIITNDDAAPAISISDASQNEGAGSGTCNATNQSSCNEITFTVTLSQPSAKDVRVAYQTDDRSAVSEGSNQDYFAESGTRGTITDNRLTIPAGTTSQTVTVTIRGDNLAEPDERFAVVLSDPSNATIADTEALGVIVNDDGGTFPTVSVSDSPDVTEASNANAQFTFTATWPSLTQNPNPQTVIVFYETIDGPELGNCGVAVAGQDYVKTTGSVSIPWNPTGTATSSPVNVPIVNNSLNEPDECFQLQVTDANAQITDPTGQATIKDDDPLPKLSIANKSVTEGTGTATTKAEITVTLTPASGQTVTVGYRTPQPNTGTANHQGEDYTNTQGTLSFGPGETTKTITVPVVADALDEGEETVNVIIENPTGATLDDTAKSAILTIEDDDNPPTISIADTKVTEGSSGNTVATFLATLSAPSGKQVTVTATTADGTAKQPGDYAAKTQTLTFAPGVTEVPFQVSVVADSLDEVNETFTATLTSPQSAGLGSPTTGTATIEDDDDSSSLSINNVTVAEGNTGTTNATFTVTLSPASGQTVTVHYATADGTATQPADYTQTSGDLSFAPDETSKTIVVPVMGDTADEPDETFTVDLSAATNAAIADGSGLATVTDDDQPGATTTTSTTIPGVKAPRITTGPNAGGGPHIKVFNANGSGPTTQFMDGDPTKETGGKRVARGDLNGDGVDEIITGSGPDNPAIVSAYSASGQLIASSFAYANGAFYGGIFVAAGDINGDGKDEILTAPGPGGGPHVRTWTLNQGLSGNDGFMAYGTNFTGGVTIASADVNGDGKDDIVTGPGAGGGPHVRVFSGATGGELFGLMAYTNPQAQPNWTGGVNVAAGDLDDDGKAEVAVTPWRGGGPHLRLFNHDGTLRHGGIFAGNPQFAGGLSVAVGDLDGDGNAEIVVGGMTQFTGVRGFRADLTPMNAPNFTAYEGFGGGVFVAIGDA